MCVCVCIASWVSELAWYSSKTSNDQAEGGCKVALKMLCQHYEYKWILGLLLGNLVKHPLLM